VHTILSFFLSRQFPRKYGTILNISFSVGLLLGISSCTFFLWLYFLGFPSTAYHVIENIFAVILIPIAFYTSKHQKISTCNQETGSDFKLYLRLLNACALIIIACFAAAFLLRSGCIFTQIRHQPTRLGRRLGHVEFKGKVSISGW
jgi:hypothetical protein